MGKDSISRCELFNRLATIPVPPEANEFKAKIYAIIQGMEAADRPRAEWIGKTEGFHSHWCCSSCGAWALLEYNEQMCLSNFCPNCGARMKGADDE